MDEGDLDRLRRLEKKNMNDAEVGPLLKYIDKLRARIASLESALAERERERFRVEHCTPDKCMRSEILRRSYERAESAETALAAARAEIARLRAEGDGFDSEIKRIAAERDADGIRADQAEEQLAAEREEIARLREQYQCQVNHVSKMFDELRNLAIEAGWDANEDLSSPMQFIRQYVRTGLVPQAGRLKEEVVELKSQLAALRSRDEERVARARDF